MKARRIVLFLAALAAVLLALESARERFALRTARNELDRTFRNVAERVQESDVIFKSAVELSDALELAQVRSFAMLVENDPGILTNQAQLAHIAEQLEVDQVCVVDEKGIVCACEPTTEIGYDMHDAEQSAVFLPAITNRDFALIQKPMPRGHDQRLCQFVGVARRDKPGIVQIAVGPERIQAFRTLVSPEDVESTSRVQRGGYVRLEKGEGEGVGRGGGRALLSRTEIIGSKRVSVGIPAPLDVLAGDAMFWGSVALSVVLLLALFQSIVPNFRSVTHVQRRACLFVFLSVALLLLSAESSRRLDTVATVHEQLLLMLENATGRVRSATANVQIVSQLMEHANLVKTNACSMLEQVKPVWPTAHVDINALAGLKDALKPLKRADGRFTEFVPGADAADKKGYFTEEREGRTYLCLSARAGDYEVVVGAPSPEGFWTQGVVWGALLALAALSALCALGALLPEAVNASWDYLKTFFAYFWGLRNERTKGVGTHLPFWKKLLNPIVLAVLIMFGCCATIAWATWSNTLRNKAKEELADQSRVIARSVSDSVDNMLLAIARAMVRHYRTPGNFTRQDAAELVHRYDIDEVSVVDANGLVRATNLGDDNYDMASHPETAKFNCLLHGATSFAAPFRAAVEDATIVRKYVGVPFPDAPGYVQIGVDLRRLTSDWRYLFTESVTGRRFGKTGFPMWVVDETGEIVANGAMEAQPDDTLASIGFNAATAPEAGVPFEADFYGRQCYAVWSPYANLRLYAIQPYDEVDVRKAMRGPLVLMSIAYFLFLKMALALSEIVAQLKKFIVAERDRQKSDMTMAKTIQMSALPIGFPTEADFAIRAMMETAREVGGDFYDFYSLPDGRLVFLVADVSGKGVPAALFMMRAKAIIRAAVFERRDDLAAAVALANNSLSDHNDAEMFVTAWIGVFDRASGAVQFVNVGHNPPILKRADGTVEWVRSRGGLVFGAMTGVTYRAHTCALGRGDTLLLYTDGVTEAMNRMQAQFGERRLECVLRASDNDRLIDAVSRAVTKFTAGAEQSDDITLLTMARRNGLQDAVVST